MPLLADKKLLITGVLSQRSIAYGIAKACKREGATLAFTYVNDELKERVVKLASEFGPCPVLPCDVSKDDQISALFDALGREWGGLDGFLHSIAFAPREALSGDFLQGLTTARIPLFLFQAVLASKLVGSEKPAPRSAWTRCPRSTARRARWASASPGSGKSPRRSLSSRSWPSHQPRRVARSSLPIVARAHSG